MVESIPTASTIPAFTTAMEVLPVFSEFLGEMDFQDVEHNRYEQMIES